MDDRTLPQSDALTEAKTDSLSELFSRDPEGNSRLDRNKIVEAQRANRARHKAAEQAGQGKVKVKAKSLESHASVEDTGL